MGTVRSGVMKTLALSSLLLAFAGIPACGDAEAPLGPPTPPPPPPPPAPAPVSIYAITNVTAITMGDGDPVLEEQTVVIRGAVIEVMGPSAQTSVPDSAIVIDGTGRFLFPGLTDMHTHVTVGSASAAADQGLSFVANGVTTILNMGDIGINGDIHALKRRYGLGGEPGPTMFTARFARGPEDGGATLGLVVATKSGAAPFVEGAKLLGYDFIKVYNWIRPIVHEALVVEANNRDMAVIGHVPVLMSAQDAVSSGQKMIAHTSEYWWQHYDTLPDESRTPDAIAFTVNGGTWLTPTLSASEGVVTAYGNNLPGYQTLVGRESFRFVHPDIRTHWRTWLNNGDVPGARDSWLTNIMSITKDFHDGGVRLLLGTDSPDVVGLASGFGVYEELRLLGEAGLAPAEVLRIATRNAGDFITETVSGAPRFGIIAPGFQADFLLLRRNPYDDISNLRDRVGVMARGTWFTQEELDLELEALATKYSR